MKEKIDQLAHGKFEYETPGILISENEIQITVDSGSIYEGSFTVKNSKNTPMKGILYSSSELFQLERNRFTEEENIINYQFHGENMNPGETMRGEICIVSDCGEVRIPFTVNIEIPYLPSSIGKIKDLFNFTNLAKSDWTEAVKLFKSKEFHQVIMHHDTKDLLTYHNLLKSKSLHQALEEFLITIRKKLYINLTVEKTSYEYQIGKESIMDKLVIKKDNWGYLEVKAEADASFISLEHSQFTTDDFVANSYSLEFVLNPDRMRTGNNYGRIYLYTFDRIAAVEIFCKCTKAMNKKEYNESNYKKINQYRYQITNHYLLFRRNVISLEQYVEDVGATADILAREDAKKEDLYHLLKVHLLIITGKDEEAGHALREYETRAEIWGQSDVVRYGAYLYLAALLKKDEETIQKALYSLRSLYDKNLENWKILWFLLYIDKKYDNYKALKLEEIKNSYQRGCKSPIMYFEAVTVLREEPALLHELGEFELQVLHWGIQYDCISEDLALKFTYLAGKRKHFHRLVHECLSIIYERYEMKDALTAICSHLIKGHQRNKRYFKWFQLGVEEQLRITEIHEYYMYTLEETAEIELPQPILLYFIYNSNLSDRKKAFLYAYVVRRKESHQALYHTYYKRIEQFALKQLSLHMVSANLSILYQEMITESGLTAEIARQLPFVMFKHEIVCNHPEMKGVVVVHKERKEEVFVPFMEGAAQVDIFTENAGIFLVDMQDNRYITTIEYTLQKLMPWEYYIGICFEMGVTHPMVIINLSEKVQNYQKYDGPSIEIRKHILEIEGLEQDYYNGNLLDLIHYYYENFEGERLEYYLGHIDLHGLSKEERDKIIEFFIIREMYDKALKALEEFGFYGISVNRLIKLNANLLQQQKEEEDKVDIIVNLSYHIFKSGKYNEDILNYLVKYFFGTTEEMFLLWQAASSFELETVILEERLLGQMLFAKSYLTNSMDVFLNYYKRGANHKLIRAFLSYNAYKYLVFDRITPPALFEIMKKELTYDENEVCMLALLKYLSTKNNMTEGEKNLVDYNLHYFVRKGLMLPFFKKLQTAVTLPPQINHKFFVEYITSPGHKVTIHYRLEGKNSQDDFMSEEMRDAYLGIRVKEFILFYNENIQYYITEEDEEGNTSITESVNVELGQDMKLDEDNRYNQLNFMLTAMDMQDDKTLMDSIRDYIKNNYVMQKAFKPL